MESPSRIDPDALLAQRSWLVRLAQGLLRDPAAAEDVVQQAWIAALDRPPRESEALRPWLARTVRNLALQWKRGEGRRRRRQNEVASDEGLPATDELVERAELQRVLATEVVGLKEPYRTVLLLRYFEGLSAAEIARRQGLSDATVRSQLKRGLDRLRETLDERCGGDRQLWAGTLVSLVEGIRRQAPPPTGGGESGESWSGTGSTLIGSLLGMKLALLAVSGAAVVGALMWWGSDGTTEASKASLDGIARAATPDVRVERAAAEEEEPPVFVVGEREEVAPAALAERAEPTPEAAAPYATVEAQLVDVLGRPLQGAVLALPDAEVEAFTGANGEVTLELPPRGEDSERGPRFVARADGHAALHVEAFVEAGSRLHLGTLVLPYAGDIRGYVHDATGHPVAGASVLAAELDSERGDPEELRRVGPDLAHPVPETRTAIDGSFHLSGVPVGHVTVWAGADGYAWSHASSVEVERGGAGEPVELLLGDLRSSDRIEGIVLDPEGRPVPQARVGYWYSAARIGTGGAYLTDAGGRFSWVVDHRVPHDLTVSDPGDRWSDVVLPAVEPGAPVAVRFRVTREIEILVTNDEGDAVESFGVTARHTDPNLPELAVHFEKERPDGILAFRLPGEVFELEVTGRGHETRTLGPFAPDDLADELPVMLRAQPGISGRVLDPDGSPRAGVAVELRPMMRPESTLYVNGFRAFEQRRADDKVITDERGGFRLFAKRAGDYVLRAMAEGYAPTVSGPWTFHPERGETDVEVRLTHGGAIVGRVLVDEGVDATGLVIALNRADGHARTLRVDADGSFRVDGLTPGPWRVEVTDEEILPGRLSSTFSSNREPPEWVPTCTVRENEDTFVDVDARRREPCVVVGELRVPRHELQGWTAVLERRDGRGIKPSESVSAPLQPDGTFRIEVAEPGKFTLVLQGPEARARLVLEERIELERGEAPWSFEFEPAHVTGRGLAPGERTERVFEYRWSAPRQQVHAVVRIVPTADGDFELPLVPAGRGEIHRYVPSGSNRTQPWELLREVDARADATTHVDLR